MLFVHSFPRVLRVARLVFLGLAIAVAAFSLRAALLEDASARPCSLEGTQSQYACNDDWGGAWPNP